MFSHSRVIGMCLNDTYGKAVTGVTGISLKKYIAPGTTPWFENLHERLRNVYEDKYVVSFTLVYYKTAMNS